MAKSHSLLRVVSVPAIAALILCIWLTGASAEIQCGAAKVDISPTQFPVIQNGGFIEALIKRNVDPLHARAIVFDDGADKVAIVVVDSCMIPRDLCDNAKALAHDKTGIPVDRILISVTHTHAAPSVMDFCLGSRKDPAYTKFLPGKIAESIVNAHAKLQPVRIGFAVANASEFTKNRRWIRRSDKMVEDPFGERTVQAMMHPGHQNPDFVGPSGPIDPDLSLLNIQTIEGKPLALLANFSMHYFSGHPGASADYYGRFAKAMHGRLAPGEEDFIAIMSQGTSGDLWWGDYSLPNRQTWDILEYTNRLAALAEESLTGIEYQADADIDMVEARNTYGRRLPDEKRLAWADQKLKEMGDKRPRNRPEVYAEQARWISENPDEEVVLQAIRIGDIAITGLPNEVYAITGLKLKKRSPYKKTFNMSLANGAAGYIPPPEQHVLGGYTTWPARTAGLETNAEPKMVESLVEMMMQLADRPYTPGATVSSLAESIHDSSLATSIVCRLDMAELGYVESKLRQNWLFPTEHIGRVAFAVEGIARPGTQSSYSMQFAGGKIVRAGDKDSETWTKTFEGKDSTVEIWFWNGFPNNARDITGYLYSHGSHALGISGTAATHQGRLFFANELGRSEIIERAWNHVMLTSDKDGNVRVYLNGDPDPEIATRRLLTNTGEFPFTLAATRDDSANFEGRIDEVTLFRKVFTPEQVVARFESFGIEPPTKPEWGEFRVSEPKPSLLEDKPLSPNETIAATHVADGFVLELVAAEPEVADPVAIDWGLDGRLWVAEMADYPYGMDGKGKPGGRVRYLQDTDGDGRYEKSTLFVDGLKFPTSVMAWRDGVLITAAPDLLFANDPDGNGVAQVKVLFSGFVQGNQQLRVNSLRWGLDNWIYCASGGHHVGFGKDTVIVNAAGESVDLGSRDFRFNPDTGVLDPQSGPSQFGRVRDDYGNWFGVQNSWPLWHYVLPDHYLRRNKFFAPPDPRVQVRKPGNPRVFPNKAIQKRFHSYEQAGRYTSACGPSIYRDDLFFSNESNVFTAFTCEPFHNVVQRHRVWRDGVSFMGERAHDGDHDAFNSGGLDFFASGDRWCRPVMSRTGPDGALYVVDMYRYMIEHPDWLPPNGREELKPFYRAGEDRGRIYRIRKKDIPLREVPPVDLASADQLIQTLASPNGIVRDLAHRSLLSVTLSKGNKDELASMVQSHDNAKVRLHALCVLDGAADLPIDVLAVALRDRSGEVRRNAVRIAEKRASDRPAIVRRLQELIADSDPSVRLQAVLSLGEIDGETAGLGLAAADLGVDPDEPFLRAAVISSAPRHIETLADFIDGLPRWLTRPLFALAWGGPASVPLLRATNGETVRGLELASDYFATLDERGDISANADPEIAKKLHRLETVHIPRVLAKAGKIVSNRELPIDHRSAAIPLLGRRASSISADIEILGKVFAYSEEQEAVRLAALDRLFSIDRDDAIAAIFDCYGRLSSPIRVAVVERALRRRSSTTGLLERIKSGELPAISIPVAHRQKLLSSGDDQVRRLAEQCFAPLVKTDRTEVIAALTETIERVKGEDTEAGAAIYKERCAVCHSIEEDNPRVGPDLRSITDRSVNGLLTAIIDPSRSVDPGYVGVSVTLKNGESYYGRVHTETGAGYNLLLIDGTMKGISREALDEIKLAPNSLMPESLESGLSSQQLANLLAYVAGLSGTTELSNE